jgi:hypothetical protein
MSINPIISEKIIPSTIPLYVYNSVVQEKGRIITMLDETLKENIELNNEIKRLKQIIESKN